MTREKIFMVRGSNDTYLIVDTYLQYYVCIRKGYKIYIMYISIIEEATFGSDIKCVRSITTSKNVLCIVSYKLYV